MTIPYQYQEIEQLYSKTVGKGLRTLAVLSSTNEEGCSSVACALAQRAMAVNKKVLLVDLNLHNPYMSNQISAVDNLTHNKPQRVQLDQGPAFSVMPVPLENSTQLELREHAMLHSMVGQWLEGNDLVIFDTSPLSKVNRHNIPPQLVAQCCDGAILVVQSGKTQQNQLASAMAMLAPLNINLVGTVVNDYTNPSLGVELIRQCCKLAKYMPKLSDWLIAKINASKFLFARF
jgi:Mrp family chromosome partitioning ATPase